MFRRVPERGAVLGPGHVGPGGELSRKDDFLVRDVAAIGVVIHLARSLIADALARAIGSGSRDSSALTTRDMLGAEKIGGHRASVPCDAVGSIVAQVGKKLKERLERVYLPVRRGRPLQRFDDFAVPPHVKRGAVHARKN